MIDKTFDISIPLTGVMSPETITQLKAVINKIQEDAAGTAYTTTTPTSSTTPYGKLAIFDDGTDKSLNLMTGKKNLLTLSSIPSGLICLWSGAISTIPAGWVICDGNNSTPDLSSRFVIHADADSGGSYDVGDTGGAATHTHTVPRDGWGFEAVYDNGTIRTEGVMSQASADNTSGAGSTLAPYYALAYIMKT